MLGRGAQSPKEVQGLTQPRWLGACNSASTGIWSGSTRPRPWPSCCGERVPTRQPLGSGAVGGPVRTGGSVASAWEGAAPMCDPGGGGRPCPKPPPPSSLWPPRRRGLAPYPPRNLARCTHLTSTRAPGSCHAVHRASSRHGEPGMGAGEAGRRPRCWPGRQGPAAPRAPAWPAPSAAPGEELPGGRGPAAPSLPPGRLRPCPDK